MAVTGYADTAVQSKAPAHVGLRARATTETVAMWGVLLTLPIERVLTADIAGFTVRPVYLFMAVLAVLNVSRIPRSGVAGVVGAWITLAIVASAFTSLAPKQTVGYAAWGMFTIVFFVSMVGRLRERRDLVETWARAYVFTAGLWGLVTLLHSVLSFGFDGLAYSFVGDLPRVQALAYEPSFLAFYLVPAFYLSFATAQHYSTAAILAGVIASTSRAGLVGLAVGGVVLLLLARRAVVKKLVICGVAAAIAGGVQLILSRGAYTGFVTSTVNVEDQASIAPRLATWSDAWEVFLEHPVNGVGIGAYGGGVHELGIALDTPDSDIKTTNLWLEVLAELGVIGFASLGALLVIALFGLWRRRRQEPLAAFVFTAIVASAAMFAFVQTWWVPYRWIIWILAYSIAFPLVTNRLRSRVTEHAPTRVGSRVGTLPKP
jgi:O-antigen ligase